MPRPKKPEEKKRRKVSITLDAELLEQLKKMPNTKGLAFPNI